jgi:hypothetical protein
MDDDGWGTTLYEFGATHLEGFSHLNFQAAFIHRHATLNSRYESITIIGDISITF